MTNKELEILCRIDMIIVGFVFGFVGGVLIAVAVP